LIVVPADNVKSGTGLTFQKHFPRGALHSNKKAPPSF